MFKDFQSSLFYVNIERLIDFGILSYQEYV